MQLEAGVLFEPGLDLGCLVGGVVVEHRMDLASHWRGLVDTAQEFQELPGSVAGHAIADDRARLHIKGGEQRGRAVAFVIMGPSANSPSKGSRVIQV